MYTTLSHLRALCVHHRVFGFVVTIILLSMTTGVSSQTPDLDGVYHRELRTAI